MDDEHDQLRVGGQAGAHGDMGTLRSKCLGEVDWATYTIYRNGGFIAIRDHGDELAQVRAKVMSVVLGLGE